MDGVNTMNTSAASTRGICGFTLKMIAVISMFIDHLGATVVLGFLYAARNVTETVRNSEGLVDQITVWVFNNWDLALSVYETMRYIGRIAFPIYCFLIVEGFLHTKNVAKYALRLGIFALVSEIPFDLAFNEGWLDLSSNNVFFTLLIGLLVIWGISYVERRRKIWKEKNVNPFLSLVLSIITGLVLVGVGAFIARKILFTDYGAAGVITIVVMYLLRKKPWQGFLLAVIVLTIMTNSSEIVALLGAVLVCYYNGERGKNMKYFFYAFYPVHLIILWFVTMILGI